LPVWLRKGDAKVGVSWVVIAGGGAERLRDGGAIGVWAPKGTSVGVAELKGDGGEPRGTVADVEGGGGEPRETVLKPKFWKRC
jgi:hypothetical protein